MQTIRKIELAFYERTDTLAIARDLIGKLLVTQLEGFKTVGRIVEAEAYAGVGDKASHARGGLRSARTEIMYGRAGKVYVYLCYGIHQMFNIVTHRIGEPHAILIRAVEPVEGIEKMIQRTGKRIGDQSITRGPSNVAKALGLHTIHTGTDLLGESIFVAEDGFKISKSQIIATPRIGVDYAAEDALLPYRFLLRNNPYVSGNKAQNQH